MRGGGEEVASRSYALLNTKYNIDNCVNRKTGDADETRSSGTQILVISIYIYIQENR